MSIKVEQLMASDDAEITEFLDNLGSASVLGYHYPFYRDMLKTIGVGESFYLGARREGKLVGYLPAFVKESAARTVVSSLPYFGPNAGVLCGEQDRAEVHAALLGELRDRAAKVNALSCSVYAPFQFNEFGLYDSALPGWEVVERFTQFQRLDEERRDSAVGRNLRKAQRLGVEVSTDVTPERIATFYEIYKENCREFGIPLKPRTALEWLARSEFVGRWTRLYFAVHEGKVVGGLMMIWSPKVASYYIPCSLTEARTLQPSTVLIDAAMREARERGTEYWNWESSPGRDSGVYRFKKTWGGEESAYRIYVQTFAGKDRLRELGREGIAREFPFYYVWPFDRL